nr:SLOG family protein [Desulfosporosinus meridiei]
MILEGAKIRTACCLSGLSIKSFHIGFDENIAGSLRLKQVLMEQAVYLIQAMRVTHFISGVDLCVGQFFAEIVLDLKRDYPEVTLECVIPCEDQAANWTIAQRDRYFSIVERCDKETLLQHHYSKDCIRKKKEYMVKQSNYVLVVWNGKPGSSGKLLSIARTLGKIVILIDSSTYKVCLI